MTRRGLTVALVGPDGAGKTTVGRRLRSVLSGPVEYLYMGVNAESSNRMLPTTRLVRALRRRRGVAASRAGRRDAGGRGTRRGFGPRSILRVVRGSLRLANRIGEELYRQALIGRHRRSGAVVVLDRDFLFDYHASDIARTDGRSLGRRIHGLFLQYLYRRPDLVIYLDAPAEVLFERKGEGTIESLAQRRIDYRRALELVPRHAIVDATQPLDAVVAEVAAIIEAADGDRRTHRLSEQARS